MARNQANEVVDGLLQFLKTASSYPPDIQAKLNELPEFFLIRGRMEVSVDNFILTILSHPTKFDRAWQELCKAAVKFNKYGHKNIDKVSAIKEFANHFWDEHSCPTLQKDSAVSALLRSIGRITTRIGPTKMKKEDEALGILDHVEQFATEERSEFPATRDWKVAAGYTHPRSVLNRAEEGQELACANVQCRLFNKNDPPIEVSNDFVWSVAGKPGKPRFYSPCLDITLPSFPASYIVMVVKDSVFAGGVSVEQNGPFVIQSKDKSIAQAGAQIFASVERVGSEELTTNHGGTTCVEKEADMK